jgi:sugar lactone lactonase YvrE
MAPDDSIWLALPDNKRILHFGGDGALLASIAYADIPGEPVWVQALAVDAEGRVYLADTDGSRLFVLGTDGSVLGTWSLTEADGSPNPNSGGMVVTPEGAVFLADWENGTLYRYQLDPPLVASEATPVATPAA